MTRTFVIGDIHGAFKALVQCLERIGFDPGTDRLIALGDIGDGWPETNLCIEYLSAIHDLVLIKGNHDRFMISWYEENLVPEAWIFQGGSATVKSYPDGMPKEHYNLICSAVPYFIDKNRLFVHGGIIPGMDLEEQNEGIFLWDRQLFRKAIHNHLQDIREPITGFDEVYIGHTPVHHYGFRRPVRGSEVWMMDTGAGWDGVLSVMNVDTKEYQTSDKVMDLYPGHPGRF